MSEMLVIVESPAKAKTIGKFLGSKYKVVASNGHVRDLPKSQLGVDVEHDFEPKYITLRGRGEVLENIRREAKAAKKIYLATDPDMEGEAISWHLAHIGDIPVFLRNEVVYFLFPVANDAYSHRLHAACGKASAHLCPEYRTYLVAHQPVKHPPCLLSVHKVHIYGS